MFQIPEIGCPTLSFCRVKRAGVGDRHLKEFFDKREQPGKILQAFFPCGRKQHSQPLDDRLDLLARCGDAQFDRVLGKTAQCFQPRKGERAAAKDSPVPVFSAEGFRQIQESGMVGEKSFLVGCFNFRRLPQQKQRVVR